MRRPRPHYRWHMRVPFSRKLWDRWLARLNGPDENDPTYRYLAGGIAEFRRKLATKEPLL